MSFLAWLLFATRFWLILSCSLNCDQLSKQLKKLKDPPACHHPHSTHLCIQIPPFVFEKLKKGAEIDVTDCARFRWDRTENLKSCVDLQTDKKLDWEYCHKGVVKDGNITRTLTVMLEALKTKIRKVAKAIPKVCKDSRIARTPNSIPIPNQPVSVATPAPLQIPMLTPKPFYFSPPTPSVPIIRTPEQTIPVQTTTPNTTTTSTTTTDDHLLAYYLRVKAENSKLKRSKTKYRNMLADARAAKKKAGKMGIIIAVVISLTSMTMMLMVAVVAAMKNRREDEQNEVISRPASYSDINVRLSQEKFGKRISLQGIGVGGPTIYETSDRSKSDKQDDTVKSISLS